MKLHLMMRLLFFVKDSGSLLISNLFESSEGLAVSLDDLFEHGLGSYPYAFLAVHRLIYDNILKSFRMLRYVKDTIEIALEMSVVFSNHRYKDSTLLAKLCIFGDGLSLTAKH